MIFKFFLVFFLSLFLINVANAKDLSKSQGLENYSNSELLILIDKQNEIIGKQNKVIEKLDKSYTEFKKEVDDHKIGQQYMNYPLWISILLGCATFIITAVGVIVAVVSIFGYKKIKENASEIASQKANDVATSAVTAQVNSQLPIIAIQEITRLIDEGKFNKQLEDAVDMILRTQNYQNGSNGFDKYPELEEE